MVKYCQNCGAEIDDNATMCPKCGNTSTLTSNKLNTLALAGFITSLISLPMTFLFGIFGTFIGIIGIILSGIGYSKTNPGEKDRKLAIAGIIMGILSVLMLLFSLLVIGIALFNT